MEGCACCTEVTCQRRSAPRNSSQPPVSRLLTGAGAPGYMSQPSMSLTLTALKINADDHLAFPT